jgi:sensor c-di-GMP phosphodiesterase-like protein
VKEKLKMTTKTIKSEDKISSKAKSIRISFENQKRAIKILASANRKKIGRKIKFDQVLEIALGLLTDEHIALIQDRSLSNFLDLCHPISWMLCHAKTLSGGELRATSTG